MFKKLVLLTIVALSALSLTAQASRESDITMLVVPREVIPIQIAQDVSRRYPVLLVSYQLVQGKLKLYAWNDENWVAVPVEDYTSGTFFANRPKHAIIVEYERFRAPNVLIPNSLWCEGASRLASTDPRVMLHLLGLHFDFPFRYWDQMAKRYGYSIEEINPALENVHWWDLRGDDLMQKRAKRDFSLDMDKWHPIETAPPPPVESVVFPEKAGTVPEVEVPASEPVKVIRVNMPETPAEKAPVLRAAPPAAKPFPSLKPEPVIAPTPVIEPEPSPAIEPAPASEPLQSVIPAPAPLVEAPAAPAAKPAAIVEADPFASEEVPAAEIVVPQEPKKPWWKLF